MRKLLLISAFLAFSFEVKAECTATPECTALGYTKTVSDCPKGALKCPYGDGYFCEESCDNIIDIGSILYEDFRVCSNLLKSKTALGIVVYLDASGKHGQAVSAKDLGTMEWASDGSSGYSDISILPNYANENLAEQDFNSCVNTVIISSHYSPTVSAVKNYAPTDGTKGKWCLPAAGVLMNLYNKRLAINKGIGKLKGTPLLNKYTWSSTEYSGNNSWAFYNNASLGYLVYSDKKIKRNVRPVIEF